MRLGVDDTIPDQIDQAEGQNDDQSSVIEPREPKGRKLRALGNFEAYEAVRGLLFELWREEIFLGEVELIKHATGSARMYGDSVRTSLPEYEGRVSRTGDAFKSFDLYAAMREVASRSDEVD